MSLERAKRMSPRLLVAACAACILTASAALYAQSKPNVGDKPPAKEAGKASTEKSDKAGDTKPDKKDAPKDKKTGTKDPEPRRSISPEELLKELQKDAQKVPRPVTPADKPGPAQRRMVEAARTSAGARPAASKLLPDGSRIVDRPGRLTREGSYFTFSFESRGQGAPEMPIRLLPNRLLEDMESVSAGGSKSMIFVVSGEVTEYRGVNYLLVQMLLVRPDLGNLK